MYEKLAAIVRIPQSTQHLQRWLYCREHLKYVWNVYCIVTNHMRDLHNTETTGHERFPRGHRTNYFRFVSTFSFFTSKQLLFLPICFTGLSDFEINCKADVPGETHAMVQRLKSVFEKQNGNVSKISLSLACCWQIGSKFTNHSRIAWRREG